MNALFRLRLFAGIALLALTLFGAGAPGQESHVGTLTGHAASGKVLFPRYCNGCHGVRGDGSGTFAPYLDPRPRDFTMGIFKCRSTPPGSLPTDQDIYETQMRGIDTTAMPSWAPLTPQIRVDIIAYLKTFSPRFANEKPAAPLPVPPETSITAQGIRHGAEVYKRLDCARCHGPLGRGNGPDAGKLVDVKNRPNPPYDYTLTSRFKCGETGAELYRTLITGMDGTTMESYYGKMTAEEGWDLVHYVLSQQTGTKSAELRALNSSGGAMVAKP